MILNADNGTSVYDANADERGVVLRISPLAGKLGSVHTMIELLVAGEPAPWFYAPVLEGNDRYAFDTVAGRWVVMLFMGSAGHGNVQEALELLATHRDLFDDERACFFGVTIDPTDVAQRRIRQALPGIRWVLDYDHSVSKRFGAKSNEESLSYKPHWLLLDPMLRVRSRGTLSDGAEIIAELRHCVGRPAEARDAPVLIIPQVLSPDLCRSLINMYEENGGAESGFMREVDGVTTKKVDHAHKRRADYNITDEHVLAKLKRRMATVVRPMIQRAFQFDATRIERFIVACYDGADGGHFRAHRDNTTKGTAHRKFACTINLNSDEYEGGDLRFPEFGLRTYRAPTGGALVFSCSLLHEAEKVIRGRRYAFLPFLYDDESARTRERNLAFVSPDLQDYRSGLPANSRQ